MNKEQKLNHIISRMQADTSVDAPADALKFVKNAFRTRAVEPKLSIVERVLAVLKADLAPNRAAFGERSAGGAQARQMLFDSGENAIDLRITAVSELFDIRGQVLGGGFENGQVVLIGGGKANAASINEIGGFRFIGVAAGEYSMTVRSEGREIAIEGLSIK